MKSLSTEHRPQTGALFSRRPSAPNTPGRGRLTHAGIFRGERGVALVVTLILLSVITFMAVTFLVVSRSEHGSVGVSTDQITGRYNAEGASTRGLARAMAQIM